MGPGGEADRYASRKWISCNDMHGLDEGGGTCRRAMGWGLVGRQTDTFPLNGSPAMI